MILCSLQLYLRGNVPISYIYHSLFHSRSINDRREEGHQCHYNENLSETNESTEEFEKGSFAFRDTN